jgi:hypothetical protein
MTIPEADSSPTLPIWRGRRGAIATAYLGVLAVICGLGLMNFAERVGVVPACRDYAQANGWQYVSMHTYSDSLTNRSGAICTFRSPEGHTEDVYLRDISLLTSFWVSFAVSLLITVPGFLILFAVLRTWLWKLRSAPQHRQ